MKIMDISILGLAILIGSFNCEDRDKSDLEKRIVTPEYKIEEKIISKKSYDRLPRKDKTISIKDYDQQQVKVDSEKVLPLSDKLEEKIISKIYIPKLDWEIDVRADVIILEKIPYSQIENPPLKKSDNRISMKDEMIGMKDFDYGKYKAMVFQNPNNKQDIEGFVHIPIVWLREEVSKPYFGDFVRREPPRTQEYLKRSTMGLVEAINSYTNIEAKVEPHLFLDTSRLFKMPFIYITTDKAFELSKIEAENFGKYLRNGGFAVLDNGMPQYEYSPAEASLKQMLEDSLGKDARFQPIPNSHSLYHSFFDFNDGAPQGDEIKIAYPSRNFMMAGMLSRMEKPVYFLEGIWLNDRLVAIYSDKGYCHKWKNISNNEPQLKMGVNFVVFALTQAGGIAQQKMDFFSSVQ